MERFLLKDVRGGEHLFFHLNIYHFVDELEKPWFLQNEDGKKVIELALLPVNEKIWWVDFTNQILVDDGGFKPSIELSYVLLINLEAELVEVLVCDDLKKLVPLADFLQVIFNQVFHDLQMGFQDVFDLWSFWVFIHL